MQLERQLQIAPPARVPRRVQRQPKPAVRAGDGGEHCTDDLVDRLLDGKRRTPGGRRPIGALPLRRIRRLLLLPLGGLPVPPALLRLLQEPFLRRRPGGEGDA